MAAPPHPLDLLIDAADRHRVAHFFRVDPDNRQQIRDAIIAHFAPAPGKQVYYPADLVPLLVGSEYSRWMREFRMCCHSVQFASPTIVNVHLGIRIGEPFNPQLWVANVGAQRLRDFGFTNDDLGQQAPVNEGDDVNEFVLQFDTNADGTYKMQALAFGNAIIPRGAPRILTAAMVDVMFRGFEEQGFYISNDYGDF